tara:strand:- start:48928 stop:50517 length:1590 start_codon:yes stop_codon:yes gene_type:complete
MKSLLLAPLAALLLSPQLLAPNNAEAAEECRVVNVDFKPTEDLQIVVWIEDTEGNFVDTVFITRKTGSYGLGNRPGIFDFNSSRDFCYGRRITTFPIWANRHGLTWPSMIFQDEDDRDLSHSISQSSVERTFCRPLNPNEALWDAQTCATTVYTDKGKFSEVGTSLYPPRKDIAPDDRDSEDVPSMIASNEFDAISKPTPLGGTKFGIVWAIPDDLPDGDYVVFMEVSKEFDQNASHDYPSPTGIPWSEYGLPYRGQPSVVYQAPFQIGGEEQAGFALNYLGYGDPDGLDGVIRDPDATITTGTEGSGAGRILVSTEGNEMYRLRVKASSSADEEGPGQPSVMVASDVLSDAIAFSFVAPGDDAQEGTVSSYEVRYLAGAELTEENWELGTLAAIQIEPAPAGTVHDILLEGLLPNTNYSVGVRATDECLNEGAIAAIAALTPKPEAGTVDACFIATAAYGSLMANEVVSLRGFRDTYLRSHATGEILVESYYTFGPALAKLMVGSPLLRRTARAALEPAIETAQSLVK